MPEESQPKVTGLADTGEKKSALILGNYRPTLQVASALAEMGFGVIVTQDCGGGYAHYSRYVDEAWDHPPLENASEFYRELGRFLHSRPDITIIYPVWENCLRDLPQYQDLLPQGVLIAGVAPDLVEACLDKPRMQKTVEGTGFSLAPYYVADNWNGLLEAIDLLLTPRVDLPGGGHMMIEQTRALLAVDVNTGSDTSLAAGVKANMATAKALPRALRVRGLGGQIILDLAPMPKKDRRTVESALRGAFRTDPEETTLVGIKSATIHDASLEGRTAYITIKFVSEEVSVILNNEGDVISGDPNQVVEAEDLWTFARNIESRDPNWQLVATETPEEETAQ